MSSAHVDESLRRVILRHALENAVKHSGRASLNPVINKVLGERQDLRSRVRELIPVINEIISYVNSLSIDDQMRLLRDLGVEIEERREERKTLPPLPEVYDNYVVTRFAPNPDFVLHLGNARPALLSHVYAHEIYSGKMILRFEDTDPRIKKPLPEAYKIIKEDLAWLGIKWEEEYIQSLRMEIYYDIARKLIERGGAYIDLLSREEFRRLKLERKPSPYRDTDPYKNLELFDKMISGGFGEGEAVLRVKTDLNHPDPSVIDWIAFRIIDTDKNPHPITGSRYVVWPTYNFAAAIDDHLMGVTHVFRGREHAQNTTKQMYIYSHMGWRYPVVIAHGRIKLEGFILSKSKIKNLLYKYPDLFKGFSDPRFGTLASLRERGIEPETVREVILDTGIKPSDASISWDIVAATNRKKIDPVTKRVFFVENPVKVYLENLQEELCNNIPYHPTNQILGHRKLCVDLDEKGFFVYVQRDDITSLKSMRLMELANIEVVEKIDEITYIARIISKDLDTARRMKLQIVQWVGRESIPTVLQHPIGLRLRKRRGLIESSVIEDESRVYQLIRVGFVKVVRKSSRIVDLLFIHE
ncbi:MAG: glutamate--tRNA ligase [Sulfolobales archaeon]